MGLSSLVYSPLKEEKKLTGWSKSTIDYIIAHKAKVEASIRGIAKSHNKMLPRSDIEDIYMDILNYLYSCDDYNVNKAYKRSSIEGVVVSLEGYVHSCIKYCVIRAITDKYHKEKDLAHNSITDKDGKEVSLIDTIPDAKDANIENFSYQLDTLCKSYESYRYYFGPDIFQIWFIRLQTMIYNKNSRYKDILTILGISKKDIAVIERESNLDGIMTSIAKAITIIGVEKAAEVLKDYTYSADKIQQVIEYI